MVAASPIHLVFLGTVLAAASGAPGLLLPGRSAWSQRVATGLMSIAALLGLAGATMVLCGAQGTTIDLPWPVVGTATAGVDALSAIFLVPVFAMGGLGSAYGLGYWSQRRHPRSGRQLSLFWGGLVAGMALLVISRHALVFLLGWEAMALSAFFLIVAEDHRDESRRAGWVYLIATHLATLTLFALFALWRAGTGSFCLQPVASDVLAHSTQYCLFILALIGFGTKAGMMPLHFWLPGAHANAPSHVSAMLSGVMLKMGIYGLVRFMSLVPEPPVAWGGVLLLLGAVSGVLGVLYAIGQHDLKRLLAYHSVENIGIILMGLGLASLGKATGRPEWIVLGMASCLLHVWNHSLFKSLLFLGAGAVVHSTRTRQIDLLGGLSRRMPWTATLFLVGAVAICGLPPLNGFVSEFILYMGLLRTSGPHGSAAVIAVPVLALIGALALACFVKVYGAVFLGEPRTHDMGRVHEVAWTMRAPMLVLAAGCGFIGLVPVFVAPALDRAIRVWSATASPPRLVTLTALSDIGTMALILTASIGLLTLLLRRSTRQARPAPTWDCGYARPTARMQYTASSFAQTLVSMFWWVLRPRIQTPQIEGPFPPASKLHTHVDDGVLDRVLVPVGLRLVRVFAWFRRFQQGLTQNYVLYILIAVLVMLSLLVPIGSLKELLRHV